MTQHDLPIIDTHQHLWDLSVLRLPWLAGDAVQSINRSHLMSHYLGAAEGLNIVRTVYMEVNADPSHHVREAEYAIDLCGRDDNPMAAAIIGGVPQDEGFRDYVTPFAESPYVKGVRSILHDADRPQGLCLDRRFVESVKLLGELGLTFDLCLRPREIDDGVRLIERCPQTRFVIDHCGNMDVAGCDQALWDKWTHDMRSASQQENVMCKISGIVVSVDPSGWTPADLQPSVEFCLDTFGEDRVFFGGDWPVCTLKAPLKTWVEALKWIVRDRPEAARRKLFHDNAARFYGLS